MESKIRPHLIVLTFEAALKSFWRRKALNKFLQASHVSRKFLSTWATGETKRDFLDRLFEELQASDKRNVAIFEMAKSLSEQTSFPDLLNWEDSDKKISDAKKAVDDLRTYLTRQDETIHSEEEREKSKKYAGKIKAEFQRLETEKEKLQQRLNDLNSQVGTQEGGYAFQSWFYDFLDFFEIQNRRPYNSGGRQIDGSLTHEGTTYLVELKFTTGQSSVTDVDSLRAKVEDKADNTMGILVSISGYSSVAIDAASGRRTMLLLLNHQHIYMCLIGVLGFDEVISRVRRHASQTGEAFFEAKKFSG